MRLHALQARDARCDRRDLSVRFARHALPCDRLYELPYGEPARVTRRALCRQNVIWGGRLVAERDGAGPNWLGLFRWTNNLILLG
jgi:hypothetical protein